MLGLALSLAGAALSALLRWSAEQRLERHSAAREVDLANLDAVAAADLPAYVVVHGTVRVDAPLTAAHAPAAPAVLVQQEQRFISSVWDAITARWYDRELVLSESTQTASFVLQRSDVAANTSGYAPVPGFPKLEINAEDVPASGLGPTATVYDAFEATGNVMRDLIGYAKGEIPKGTRTVEQIVPANQRLTAYGELVRTPATEGGWRLRPPMPGTLGVFFLSPNTRLEIERNDRTSVRVWTVALVVTSGAAAYFLFQWLRPILVAKYARWSLERRRRKAAAAAAAARASGNAPPNTATPAPAADAADPVGTTCILCMEAQRDTVLVPCGHLACCQECSARLRTCPLCRTRIVQAVRVFNA